MSGDVQARQRRKDKKKQKRGKSKLLTFFRKIIKNSIYEKIFFKNLNFCREEPTNLFIE